MCRLHFCKLNIHFVHILSLSAMLLLPEKLLSFRQKP